MFGAETAPAEEARSVGGEFGLGHARAFTDDGQQGEPPFLGRHFGDLARYVVSGFARHYLPSSQGDGVAVLLDVGVRSQQAAERFVEVGANTGFDPDDAPDRRRPPVEDLALDRCLDFEDLAEELLEGRVISGSCIS